jgi:hypothetical protein
MSSKNDASATPPPPAVRSAGWMHITRLKLDVHTKIDTDVLVSIKKLHSLCSSPNTVKNEMDRTCSMWTVFLSVNLKGKTTTKKLT